VQVPVTYECGGSASGWGALLLEDAAVFDGDPQHEALVEIDGSVTILRAGRQQLALGSPPSDMEVAGTFLVEGVLHFATGLDHVLFLLGLLLGAGTSIAASGTREAAREIVLVISGFTLGHSLTLALAVLDIVSVPARIVEPAIAASIVVVAAWNFQRPEARRELAYLAATFGLVHGLGFSSILAEILPTHGKTVPLIAFNLGLEVAQLAVVGLALAPLAWSARKVWYRRVVVQGGSALVGCAGLFWLAERLGSS
jgi:hypothetical protein